MLAVEPDAIDLGRFEQLVASARGVPAEERARTLREALALWRGPALAEFAFDAFALPEARRLEELRISTQEEAIDAELERGGPQESAVALRKAVLPYSGWQPIRY